MRSISPKQLILAVILSFLALFINALWQIESDNNIFPLASLYLITSQLIIFLTLSFFSYHILGALKNPRKKKAIIIAAIVYMALWLYFLFDHILPPSFEYYVVHGKILAERYGINWFWMDWGIWVKCITVYLLGVYLYLVNLLLNFFHSPIAQKKKRKTDEK